MGGGSLEQEEYGLSVLRKPSSLHLQGQDAEMLFQNKSVITWTLKLQ